MKRTRFQSKTEMSEWIYPLDTLDMADGEWICDIKEALSEGVPIKYFLLQHTDTYGQVQRRWTSVLAVQRAFHVGY